MTERQTISNKEAKAAAERIFKLAAAAAVEKRNQKEFNQIVKDHADLETWMEEEKYSPRWKYVVIWAGMTWIAVTMIEIFTRFQTTEYFVIASLGVLMGVGICFENEARLYYRDARERLQNSESGVPSLKALKPSKAREENPYISR